MSQSERHQDAVVPAQAQTTDELRDVITDWIFDRHRGKVLDLVRTWPRESRSVDFGYGEIETFSEELALDLLDEPDQTIGLFEEAVERVEIPIDVDLSGAHVRVSDLPELYVFHPGAFSPSEEFGTYRTIRGEVSKATALKPEIQAGAFECQRCGVVTTIGEGHEPHQCNGCERQGPFRLIEEQSEFIDRQKARIKTPPEVSGIAGSHIDALLRDDIAGDVQPGDRVELSGVIRLQATDDDSPIYDDYLDVYHVAHEDKDEADLDIMDENRELIAEILSGEYGPPLEVAGDALNRQIYGYDTVKQALIIAAVGGDPQHNDDGTRDRGDIHLLMIGDPATGKSKLGDAIHNVAPRSVDAQSALSTGVGLTASCVRSDEFGDGGWEIRAGAFVKANGGLLWLDELADLPPDERKNLNNPMEKQRIKVNKASVEAEFATEATVIAAANPDNTVFDPYEPLAPQFGFEQDIISRFDLAFTFQDQPDKDIDPEIARSALESNYRAVKRERGESVEDDIGADEVPLDHDLLRKWIFLARKQGPVTWRSVDVMQRAASAWVNFRGLYGYEDDGPRSVSPRNLGAIRRVSQAVAKFHLADAISMDHLEIAMDLIRASMADVQTDEDGNFDADVVETGVSKKQDGINKSVADTFNELVDETDDNIVHKEDVVDALPEHGRLSVLTAIKKLRDQGQLYDPDSNGEYHIVGGKVDYT